MTQEYLFQTGNALFIKYFYNPHVPVFKGTALPGIKEGVSGGIVIPTNLAVNKYIEEDRIKAAIEFLKFVALKETQKKYIITNYMFSADMELYDDDEVCGMIECDIIRNSYPFSFMNNDEKLFGDDNYHIEYRENMFDYIYNDKPVNQVLKIIDDITKIYTFSLKTDDSNLGLIIYIFYYIFFTFIALSIIFVYVKKFEYKFKFLSKNLWVITTLGSLILMSSILTLYGDVTNTKCHLRITLINVGFVLSICPSFLKLIINFPKSNKLSSWIENNKYILIIIIMIFTLGLNKIFAMSAYEPQEIIMSDNRKYQKCIINNIFGSIIYYIIQFYSFFIIIISLILIFIEWNLKETSLDVKYIATALFMDILSSILLIIIEKINIKDYVIYNVILAINILLFSISNHIFIYLVRILPMFRPNSKYENSRKLLGKVSKSNSGIDGSKKHTMENSPYNKPLVSNSSYNKYTMAISPHNKPSSPTSPYNNPSMPASPYNKSSMPASPCNKPSVPASPYNKYSTPTSSYNKYSMPTSSYNSPSTKNYDFPLSRSSSNYNDTKKTGIARKIMDYHNQTDRSYD